jgi:hypothetical protein
MKFPPCSTHPFYSHPTQKMYIAWNIEKKTEAAPSPKRAILLIILFLNPTPAHLPKQKSPATPTLIMSFKRGRSWMASKLPANSEKELLEG